MQTFRLRKLLQKIPLDVEKKYLLLDALSKFQSPSHLIFTNYLLRIGFFFLLCFNVTICTLKHLQKINVSNIYIVDKKKCESVHILLSKFRPKKKIYTVLKMFYFLFRLMNIFSKIEGDRAVSIAAQTAADSFKYSINILKPTSLYTIVYEIYVVLPIVKLFSFYII